jgi:hypothetical protein
LEKMEEIKKTDKLAFSIEKYVSWLNLETLEFEDDNLKGKVEKISNSLDEMSHISPWTIVWIMRWWMYSIRIPKWEDDFEILYLHEKELSTLWFYDYIKKPSGI